MRTKTYERAEELRRKHAPDPVRELLDDFRRALSEAESDHERAAIKNAADTAAAQLLGDDRAGFEAFTGQTYAATYPDEFTQQLMLSDENGEPMTLDSLMASDERVAKVVASVRGADTAAAARQRLNAGIAALDDLTPDQTWLLESLWELEVGVDDGTIVTDFNEADRQAHAAKMDQAVAEAEESVDRIPAFLAQKFAEADARLSAAEVVEASDGEA